jgi:hypothetical protein
MQPLYEVTLIRPWHWGIAVVSAMGAELPRLLSGALVTASPDALVIKVRHAQDTDADVFEGDLAWATASVRVRSLTRFESEEPALHEGTLRLPGGRLTIGDADSEVTVSGLDETNRVRVSVVAEDGVSATEVVIDMAPAL